ncbi:SurA N-terminal domain-containing protein [Paracoccus sp. p3-h83]|uniref:peptidylprolyl isomerase n=1 Tax=Paracoccus sp. p3-h83 TaxID=3342805 RepID=UPI0035B8B975
MTTTLRSKGKSSVYWVLMGFMILGLGGFGVTNFSGMSSQDIGAVGDTGIDADDYARALRSQLDAMAQQGGRRPTLAEAQQIGLDRNVQSQLFASAALGEAARRIGLSVGDDEVLRQIQSVRAFQGPNGGFNRAAYADLLRREGMTEAAFEAGLRSDAARGMMAQGITGATAVPVAVVDSYVRWLTETRDISVAELTPADLPSPLPAPTDDELRAFHSTHAEQFTRPETRRITYISLTPEALKVNLDEAALRALYDQRHDQFMRPERRMVEVLVYPDAAAAQAARDRLDKGEVSFADLAAERGLTLSDIDKGEVTEAQLGAAGPTVFAAADNGVVGPVTTDLGPALVAVNAILEAQETSFEEARADLAAEAAADQARRTITERSPDIEDALASGATLEEVAKEQGMTLGTIEVTAATMDDMAAYPSFRETALKVGQTDFPELGQLNDGGVFALRLDGIDPPALIEFDTVHDQVAEAWLKAEMDRALAARAEDIAAKVEAGTSLADQGLAARSHTGIARDDLVDSLPPIVTAEAFDLTAPAMAGVAEGDHRVFVVALDAIHQGGQGDEAKALHGTVERNVTMSIAQDIEVLFTRAIQDEAGITIDPGVIAAVNARVN